MRHRFSRLLTFCLAITMSLAAAGCSSRAAEDAVSPEAEQESIGFWYEENNGDGAGQYPEDFYDMFTKPETWDDLRSQIDTYILRGNTLENLMADPRYGEAFFRDHFIPVLNEAGINIAIDNPQELDGALRTFIEMGANVTHLSVQSAVSKTKDDPEAIQARIDRAIEIMKAYKEAYPDMKIGFGDATPTKGREYRDRYMQVKRRLEDLGYTLDFIHLDAPFEAMQSRKRFTWEEVQEVERFVKDSLGADFGFISTSRVARDMFRATGEVNEDVWHREFFERVTSIPQYYEDDGSMPDYFILNSWYAVPEQSVPEDAPEGVYPMTKVGLNFVQALEKAYGDDYVVAAAE